MRAIQPRLAGALVLLLALVLFGSACGSNGGEAAETTATSSQGTGSQSDGPATGGADPQPAALEFAKCMREHGIDMPDPELSGDGLGFSQGLGGGVDPGDPKFREAQQACGGILGGARPPDLTPSEEGELKEAALEFAKCMRKHGVDFQDPDVSGGRVTLQLDPDATSDPDFPEAQRTCEPIMLQGSQPAAEGAP